MRPRHAAALSWLLIAGCMQSVACGAWLLLVPPITMDGIVDSTQPLSEWRQAWNFGTQTDCIAFLQRQRFMIHCAFGPLTSGSAQNADQTQRSHYSRIHLSGGCVRMPATGSRSSCIAWYMGSVAVKRLPRG
jgi:hypothetical protein